MVRNRFKFLFTSYLAVMLALATAVTAFPGQAQAANFGGPADNGTAAYMGIGHVPHDTRPLYVFGNVALFERAQDSAGFIIQRTPTNRWVLGVNENASLGNGFVLSTYAVGDTSSTPRLLVTTSGNVGIGTASPTRKLQVETAGGEAVYGQTGDANQSAISGKNNGNGPGVYGESASTGQGVGVLGTNTAGAHYGALGTYTHAGYFNGNVEVTGNLTRAGNTVWDESNGCVKVAGCSTCGGLKHFEWMGSVAFDGNIYNNGYVQIKKYAGTEYGQRTFGLACGHGSGCSYVYYLDGTRYAGQLDNGATENITMTGDGSDVTFKFAKRVNGMDMLIGEVFDTNGSYMHFICHDTKE